MEELFPDTIQKQLTDTIFLLNFPKMSFYRSLKLRWSEGFVRRMKHYVLVEERKQHLERD